MKKKKQKNGAAIVTLLFLAPLITEVLPGYTRFSSMFVFPIEMCVWGGGALLIRYAVRRWKLGWGGMLLMGLALSVAEEFLIQQTSLAPMVIHLKGQTYARALGINYVYLLWALIDETVFVVFLPIHLTELIFPDRKDDPWISRTGAAVFGLLFLAGTFFAWFTWTRIARPKVFHVPAFSPPLPMILIALALIAGLLFTAIRFFKIRPAYDPKKENPPASWILAVLGGVWAIVLYGLVLLGFGIAPGFPPVLAIAGGLALAAAGLYFVPRWSGRAAWDREQTFFIVSGIVLGSMLAGFIGFIGSAQRDLVFKLVTNLLALIFLVWVGSRISTFGRRAVPVP